MKMNFLADHHTPWGSSFNYVKGLGVSRICDNNNKSSAIKSVIIGGRGVNNNPNLRDVIYGRPHITYLVSYNSLSYNLLIIRLRLSLKRLDLK
jgi:hypothetical protein